MSKTKIVRKIDDLGRIVLPKDIRKTLNIHTGDLLELETQEDVLAITKYSSIQAISYLLEVILDTLYVEYHMEVVVLEEGEILKYASYLPKEKIEKKLSLETGMHLPLKREGKIVAELVFFSLEEKYQEIVSFLSSFLNRYLEES